MGHMAPTERWTLVAPALLPALPQLNELETVSNRSGRCRTEGAVPNAPLGQPLGIRRVCFDGRKRGQRPLSLSCLVQLVYLIPVHYVPEGGDVLGPAVLVLQVVSVLPDVETQKRRVALHDGAVLVGCAVDGQLAVFLQHEPRPAGAEAPGRSRRKLLFKLVETAEGLVDRLGDFAGRRAAAVRAQDLPEQGMVRVAAAVVAHRGA